jgi:hypothetical protein
MSWNLNFIGNAAEQYERFDEVLTNAKEGRTVTEKEHIDIAGEVFKGTVPNDPKLEVNFSVTGHAPNKNDVIFNSTCSVYAR